MLESSNGSHAKPDIPELPVVCAPVVIITQEESEKLAAWAPIKLVKNCNNAILVAGGATPETLSRGMGDIFIVHHAQNKVSGKARVVGQWQIPVPVLGLDFRGGSTHIFRVKLDDMVAPGSLAKPDKTPPDIDHESLPQVDLRAGNCKIPVDMGIPSVN